MLEFSRGCTDDVSSRAQGTLTREAKELFGLAWLNS